MHYTLIYFSYKNPGMTELALLGTTRPAMVLMSLVELHLLPGKSTIQPPNWDRSQKSWTTSAKQRTGTPMSLSPAPSSHNQTSALTHAYRYWMSSMSEQSGTSSTSITT